jgi:hypothetical protein
MTRRVIWCLGMYASASTWLFNVVSQICAARQPGEVSNYFVSGVSDLPALDRQQGIGLVKSHEIANEAALIGLAGRADSIFITLRDPRDAVASLLQYHRLGFDNALSLVEQAARLCLDFSKDQRAAVFHYEDRFFETASTVQMVARRLGYDLSETAAQTIFDRLDRAAVERHIAGLPAQKNVLRDPASGDFLDPQTHWHTHHAGRSGEIGRWRQVLLESQVRQVELRCPVPEQTLEPNGPSAHGEIRNLG